MKRIFFAAVSFLIIFFPYSTGLQSGAFDEIAPANENAKMLHKQTLTIEECLKGCNNIKKKLEDSKNQLQSNLNQQQDCQNLIALESGHYNREFDKCKVRIFEGRKIGTVLLGEKGSSGPNVRESGWMIAPDCQYKLENIKKDIANLQTRLTDLQTHADSLQKQATDVEAQVADCIRKCEDAKAACLQVAEAVKKSMEEGVAAQEEIEALAGYDSTADKIRATNRTVSYLIFEREKALKATESILNNFLSCQPLPWGIPIDGNTHWKSMGFLSNDLVSKATAEYSGGLYVPLKSARVSQKEKSEASATPSQLPLQLKSTPRAIRMVSPTAAISGKPFTLAVMDESGSMISGAVIATEKGEPFTSGEDGRVAIPAMLSEFDFMSFYLPGTISSPATIRFISTVVKTPPQGTPPHIDSAPDLATIGSIFEVNGSGFDGIAVETEISIGEKKITPLAESPVSMKFEIPKDISPGSYTVTIKEKERAPAEIPLLCIKIKMTADAHELKKGETIVGRIMVEGTDKPLLIEIVNYTPQLISLDKKMIEVKDKTGEFKIKGIRPGSFSIGIGSIKFSLIKE